jgi:hypothetical protein
MPTVRQLIRERLASTGVYTEEDGWIQSTLLHLLLPDAFQPPDGFEEVFPGLSNSTRSWLDTEIDPASLVDPNASASRGLSTKFDATDPLPDSTPSAVVIFDLDDDGDDPDEIPADVVQGNTIGPELLGEEIAPLVDAPRGDDASPSLSPVASEVPSVMAEVSAELARLKGALAALQAEALDASTPDPSPSASSALSLSAVIQRIPSLRPASERWVPHPIDRDNKLVSTMNHYKLHGAVACAVPFSRIQLHGRQTAIARHRDRMQFDGWPMEVLVFVCKENTTLPLERLGPVVVLPVDDEGDVPLELHIVFDAENRAVMQSLTVNGVHVASFVQQQRNRKRAQLREARQAVAQRDAEEMANG